MSHLPDTKTFQEEGAAYIAPSELDSITHIPFRGEHSVYYDTEDAKYIDFSGGILTNIFGHGDSEIAEALRDGYLQLNNIHGRYSPEMLRYCRRLFRLLPCSDYCLTVYGDGGGYTIDRALTVFYYYFGKRRYRLLTFREGFHGKTQAAKLAISLTENATCFDSYQIPAPDCSHCPYQKKYGSCGMECAKRTEEFMLENDIQVFLFEPVLGAQVIIPPKEYWERIQRFCKSHHILTLDDEVLTGGGRTGSYLAADHYGLEPDVIVMTKGVACGLPCSVLLLRRTLVENAHMRRPCEMASTYVNLPLLIRIADTVLAKLERENVLENVRIRSKELSEALLSLKNSYAEVIGDVRCIGLFGAIEFSGDTGYAAAQRVFAAAEKHGLELINSGHILRIGPALNITHEELLEGMRLLNDTMQEVIHG